jgi:hypothetical protein
MQRYESGLRVQKKFTQKDLRLETLLETRPLTTAEIKRNPKPSRFRGETNIFVGRQEDIAKVKQYVTELNAPIAIVGEGGLGKSALAYKTMHECEDVFDVIIPVYFESLLTYNSFLLELAKSLQLPLSIDKFEQLGNEDKADIIRDALAKSSRALIYADNYETIRNIITEVITTRHTVEESREEKENAIKINDFLVYLLEEGMDFRKRRLQYSRYARYR